MDPLILFAFVGAVALSFANGANDVSKAIATLVGAGVTSHRQGLLWGATWTGVGALVAAFAATAMLTTFVSGWFISGTQVGTAFPLAVVVAAAIWILLASRLGLPVSTTHSLTGAIVGLGAVALGVSAVAWPLLVGKVLVPLLVSPFVGLLLSFLIVPLLQRLVDPTRELTLCIGVKQPQFVPSPGVLQLQAASADGQAAIGGLPSGMTSEVCIYMPTVVKLNANRLHWLSSAGIAFSRALNDTPKIAAIVVMAGLATGSSQGLGLPLYVALALGMVVGSLAGNRVTAAMGHHITNLSEVDGFIANLVTAGLVGFAANFGLPVSTTHVSNGSIIGVGLRDRAGVRWKTVREFVLAWAVTLPASAVLAIAAYPLVQLVAH